MVRLCVHDDAIRQAHGCVRRGCNRACGSRDYRMDHPPTAPLPTDEAKARLLEAVDRCSPTHWLRAHPWGSVAVGLLSGFILGCGCFRVVWFVLVFVCVFVFFLVFV